MARASTEDPLKGFRFQVFVDGFVRAGFTECSGINVETDEASYREGGFNDTVQKSAGLSKFGDITLTRGQIVGSQRGGDNDFLTWALDVFNIGTSGNALNYRRDIDITQFSASNVRVRTTRVYNCWPKGFNPFSDMKGETTENSMEKLVLANEGWEVLATP